MSLKRRIARLERDVEWLWWSGRLRAVELRMKIIEIQKGIDKAQAAAAPAVPRPSPKPSSPPADPPAPSGDPPESIPGHMQVRPVQWRQRGPDDNDDG